MLVDHKAMRPNTVNYRTGWPQSNFWDSWALLYARTYLKIGMSKPKCYWIERWSNMRSHGIPEEKTQRNFKASSLHFGKYILWSAFPTFWKERGISEAWRKICWDYLLCYCLWQKQPFRIPNLFQLSTETTGIIFSTEITKKLSFSAQITNLSSYLVCRMSGGGAPPSTPAAALPSAPKNGFAQLFSSLLMVEWPRPSKQCKFLIWILIVAYSVLIC